MYPVWVENGVDKNCFRNLSALRKGKAEFLDRIRFVNRGSGFTSAEGFITVLPPLIHTALRKPSSQFEHGYVFEFK